MSLHASKVEKECSTSDAQKLVKVIIQFHAPAALFPREASPVPIQLAAGLVPEPVWTI
jgi:hypothetical protein